MSDSQNNNAAATAEATNDAVKADAPKADTDKAPEEAKSTDTGTLKNFTKPKDEPKAEPKKEPEKQEPQHEPDGDAGENNAPSADDDSEGKKKKDRLPRWVKERMERVKRVTEAETRERVLAELQARKESEKPAPSPEKGSVSTNDKTLEDFDWDQDAYVAYKVEREITKREQKREAEKTAKAQAEAAEKFKTKIDAFEEKAGDGAWEDIETSPLNTDPKFKSVVDMFLGDDNDLQIAHHLATNLEEADRLLTMTPLARVKELAKLADSFSDTPDKKAAQPPKKITNAPPPSKTVTGSGKPEVTVDDPEISPEQRIALWKAKRKSNR